MSDFIKIENGLDLLLKNDGHLLKVDVAERAITHKLAEYLQELYPEWNVDCEYNRNFDKVKDITKEEVHKVLLQMAAYLGDVIKIREGKKIVDREVQFGELPSSEEMKILREQLSEEQRIVYDEDLEYYIFLFELHGKTNKMRILPDIIIHHRGTSENKIVIEAKKTTNNDLAKRFLDLTKLAALVSSPRYKYQSGFFIDIPAGSDLRHFRSFEKNDTYFEKVFMYTPR